MKFEKNKIKESKLRSHKKPCSNLDHMTSDMLADIYEAFCAATEWKYIPLPHTQCCVDELRYHMYSIF